MGLGVPEAILIEAVLPEVAAAAGAEIAGAEIGSAMLPELLSIPEMNATTPFLESLPGIDTLPQGSIPSEYFTQSAAELFNPGYNYSPEIPRPDFGSPPTPFSEAPIPPAETPTTFPPTETPTPPFEKPYGFEGPQQPGASMEEMERALRQAQSRGGIEDFFDDPIKSIRDYVDKNKFKSLMMAAGIGSTLGRQRGYNVPSFGPKPSYRYGFDPNRYRPSGYADGGIASVAPPGYDMMVGETPAYADGGGISDLGTYSDGGRMLKGAGDGMSDSIPGVIGGKRPARLADGEFVVPADVVSHLGNGSTDAGAKQLYKMMDKVRAARTGTRKQGRQINPRRFMPA